MKKITSAFYTIMILSSPILDAQCVECSPEAENRELIFNDGFEMPELSADTTRAVYRGDE